MNSCKEEQKEAPKGHSISVSPKSRLSALLLCLTFGGIGAHRVYAKKYLSGALMASWLIVRIIFLENVKFKDIHLNSYTSERIIALLAAITLLWQLIDLAMISLGKFKDNKGQVISCWKAYRVEKMQVSPASRRTALLLCIFLGGVEAHRIYTGRGGSAFLRFFGRVFLGVCGLGFISFIWWLVDLYQISAGTFKDSDGFLVSRWQKLKDKAPASCT